MPSEDQIVELHEYCTHTWIQLNNVNGMLFTGPNGNTIFLPAAGDCYSYYHSYTFSTVGAIGNYWTSSLTSWGTQNPVGFYLYSNFWSWNGFYRYYGYSVRPVSQ